MNNVLKCFHGAEHEFRFIENSLPFKVSVSQLKDVNVTKLLETHGKLASYFHHNKYPTRIDFRKLSTIASESDAEKVEEILKFLEDNFGMIEFNDLKALTMELIRNADKEQKYWRYFPNYMSILNRIIKIAISKEGPEMISFVLEKIIGGTAENEDITLDELVELYESVSNGLEHLLNKQIKIDVEGIKI